MISAAVTKSPSNSSNSVSHSLQCLLLYHCWQILLTAAIKNRTHLKNCSNKIIGKRFGAIVGKFSSKTNISRQSNNPTGDCLHLKQMTAFKWTKSAKYVNNPDEQIWKVFNVTIIWGQWQITHIFVHAYNVHVGTDELTGKCVVY